MNTEKTIGCINSKDVFNLKEIELPQILFEVNDKKTPLPFIVSKNHVKYLQDYLSKDCLNASYVVVERNYINKDYLTDYSSYYSFCFESYSKLCCRLHFFSTDESKDLFIKSFSSSIIEGIANIEKNKNYWNNHYLGHIVIKPIPNFFIGFTLLKHFNFNLNKPAYKKERLFWGVKEYKVHIYGNEIEIDSLAFQEQDRNVAACATISIWSMLQRAAEDYYVILQSPGEITRGSGLVANDGNRLIPNKGLSIAQMAQAITKNNLATEVRDSISYNGEVPFNVYIKKLIHAYSPLKIPIILAIKLPETNQLEKYVGHAVAISGYSSISLPLVLRMWRLKKFKERLLGQKSIIWEASSINKLYVHDDQWGPYSKFEFRGGKKLSSNWNINTLNKRLGLTDAIVISVYHKVRIPYEDIEVNVLKLNQIFEDHLHKEIKGNFVWDIQIFYSQDFKNQIQKSEVFDKQNNEDREIILKFLTKNLPKYVWVATLFIGEKKVYHFIYDATGLISSNILIGILGYYPKLTEIILNILNKYIEKTDPIITYLFTHNILGFIEKLKEFK